MGSSSTRFYGSGVPSLLKLFLQGERVLDLGAGDGEILYGLKNELKDAEVIAVEISPVRCEQMRKEFKNIKIICRDATKTKLRSGYFDFIICNQVIEHIEKYGKLIREIYRLLKPGGGCFLSTVYKEKFNFGYYRNKKGERVLDPTHVCEYTNNDLKLELSKVFKIYSHKIPIWFSITDFILPRLGIQGHIYETNKWLRMLRKIKLPIIGYYTWEFMLWKK
jgi:ubiquinone/menaquinone biosynthesis C-methylase UbiE